MVKKEIEKNLKKILQELKKEGVISKDFEFQIEVPPKKEYGDYATNLALVLAKKLKKEPIEVANFIILELQKQKLNFFSKIEIKPPAFINFFISEKLLTEGIRRILDQKENFGKTNLGKNKKTNIEFISANPTGPLHIGNGRGAFFGDVLANVLEFVGFDVKREYYINNAKNNTQIQMLGETALGEGRAYLNEYLEKKIKKLRKKLQKITDKKEAGFLLAKEIQKDIKNFIEKKLKIKIDNWVEEENLFKESEIQKTLNWLKRKKLVYQKEKALWIKTSLFGEKKDWVVVRENGQPTYLLSDIAYHRNKIKRGYKKIINIWGADHQAHVDKMKAVVKMLNFKGDFEVLISQIVTLRGGKKLSKRKGQIISLEELISKIGNDVARFFYLEKDLNTHMEFDLDLAKEQSMKNPVYYVQYAYVRACSILRKAKDKKIFEPKVDIFTHPKEIDLAKKLIIFPEIVENVARTYQLHQLITYAKNLATSFHQFYQECRVIGEKDARKRIALVLATKIVFQNLFKLLGISLPEKM